MDCFFLPDYYPVLMFQNAVCIVELMVYAGYSVLAAPPVVGTLFLFGFTVLKDIYISKYAMGPLGSNVMNPCLVCV